MVNVGIPWSLLGKKEIPKTSLKQSQWVYPVIFIKGWLVQMMIHFPCMGAYFGLVSGAIYVTVSFLGRVTLFSACIFTNKNLQKSRICDSRTPNLHDHVLTPLRFVGPVTLPASDWWIEPWKSKGEMWNFHFGQIENDNPWRIGGVEVEVGV